MSEPICTVLCALPCGLICELGTVVNSGGLRVRGPNYRQVVLAGKSANFRRASVARDGRTSMVSPAPNLGGDAPPGVTENVPLDFMREWLEQNAELPSVRNKLIRIVEVSGDVAAASAELGKVRTGLEPMAKPVADTLA